MLPLTEPEQTFTELHLQGKHLKIGDAVVVHHAGERKTVTVSSLIKRNNHYWVGYADDRHMCPWPLVQVTR